MKLEKVFKRLSPLAFSVSLAILKSREEAEDVVSEIFLHKIPGILEKNPGISLEEMGRLIVTIAKNRSIDVYRRNKKSVPLVVTSGINAKMSGTEVDNVDFNRAMDGIEPRYREVLTLKYLWGMTWQEVAKKTGLSQQGSRKRAGKGLSLFKKLFTGSETEDNG
ncbi:MAG: sigma-70 family RNA polymerase sigma factor [Fibrobacteria bacterium]|nr:sigma-70 family RNA polymerase sigma factor [Fibrobacteria bacterium]